jgi:thioredoxin 1
MSAEVTITAENFEQEVLKSDIPVLTDFWAEWCMPCKMIAPTLEELAEEYKGKLKVAKVDVDSLPDLAQKYNIVSIPTLLLFKNGEIANQHIGAGSKTTLEGIFKSHI